MPAPKRSDSKSNEMGDPFLISRVRLPFALPEKTLSGNEKPKFFKEVLDISSRAETLLASPAFPSGCVLTFAGLVALTMVVIGFVSRLKN